MQTLLTHFGTWLQIPLLATGLVLLAGCVAPSPAPSRRQLIAVLDQEMQTNSGWVQVHAADALLDHGETQAVRKLFAPFAETPPAAYRVGVWRVMARAAATEPARHAYVERVRLVMLDAGAPDRLQAAESLAKLGIHDGADLEVITRWIAETNDATAACVRWLLVLSSPPSDREANELALSAMLDSNDAIARLRAAFALGKLKSLSAQSLSRLRLREAREPEDSPVRVYLITANLRHAGGDEAFVRELKRKLYPYLTQGKANEQLEAATVLGLWGNADARPALNALLDSPEPDARIGAANGLLYLQP